jgi:hypothetical protein
LLLRWQQGAKSLSAPDPERDEWFNAMLTLKVSSLFFSFFSLFNLGTGKKKNMSSHASTDQRKALGTRNLKIEEVIFLDPS